MFIKLPNDIQAAFMLLGEQLDKENRNDEGSTFLDDEAIVLYILREYLTQQGYMERSDKVGR